MRVLLILLILPFAMQHSLAADKTRSDAYNAYTEQAATTAIHAVRTELLKDAGQFTDDPMDLRFQVDPTGRVHNVKVISGKANQSAKQAAERALTTLRLPPFPVSLAAELGNRSVDIATPLLIPTVHSGDTSTRPETASTIAYLTRCNEIIMTMLDAEAVKHRGDFDATLEIILLLDPKGHVVAQKVIATPPHAWLNEMAAQVVRDAKLPAMPAKVVAEHKGDLVPFATKWVYARR